MARAFRAPTSAGDPRASVDGADSDGSVSVRCFPPSDRQFSEHVRVLLAESWEAARDAEALLAMVRGKLAARYPLATVHPRHELAELGTEEGQTWYVYRDGRAA